MTIWNLHGTGIQLRIIHSRAHILICNLSFICSVWYSFPFFFIFLFLPFLDIQLQNNITVAHLHSFFRSLTILHALARFTPRRANQLPDNLSRFLRVFLYSVCLYSYNNHFPNDYTLNSSNFLHFFTNNNWIVAPNFLSAHFFVIEFAIVLVTVSMHGAE